MGEGLRGLENLGDRPPGEPRSINPSARADEAGQSKLRHDASGDQALTILGGVEHHDYFAAACIVRRTRKLPEQHTTGNIDVPTLYRSRLLPTTFK